MRCEAARVPGLPPGTSATTVLISITRTGCDKPRPWEAGLLSFHEQSGQGGPGPGEEAVVLATMNLDRKPP